MKLVSHEVYFILYAVILFCQAYILAYIFTLGKYCDMVILKEGEIMIKKALICIFVMFLIFSNTIFALETKEPLFSDTVTKIFDCWDDCKESVVVNNITYNLIKEELIDNGKSQIIATYKVFKTIKKTFKNWEQFKLSEITITYGNNNYDFVKAEKSAFTSKIFATYNLHIQQKTQ